MIPNQSGYESNGNKGMTPHYSELLSHNWIQFNVLQNTHFRHRVKGHSSLREMRQGYLKPLIWIERYNLKGDRMGLQHINLCKLCGVFDKFPEFFVEAFKIVVDSWKFSMLLLYILWDDWPIFMISASIEQLQQQLQHTLLKLDCHSRWISKMQSVREDSLEEQYAIKFCFKLEKKSHRNVWNASGCFSTILHESSICFWVA